MAQRTLKAIQIETINKCNARCVFCYYPKQEEYRDPMEMSLFKKIINDLKEFPPLEIMPFLNGEPFLDKTILEKLDYITATLPEYPISIYTNGYCLDEKTIKELKNFNIRYMNISLNAISDDERINSMKIPLTKTIDNIKILKKTLHKTRITASLLFDPCYVKRSTFELFKSFCMDLSVESVQYLPSNFAGEIREAYNVANTCIRLDGHMTVLSTGQVNLCCQDVKGKINFGDLNKQSVKKIWDSNAFLYYYNMNQEKKRDQLYLCNQCTGV